MKDKKYLERVRKLDCVVRDGNCYGETVAHHKTGAGMGMKASDYDTFTLCLSHHTAGGYGVAIHAGTVEWERKYNTQDYFIKQTQTRLSGE